LRNEHSLSLAVEKLNELQQKFSRNGKCLNREEYEFKNMLVVSRLIANCALSRKESRGAHYRTDYLNTHNECVHSCISKEEGVLDFVK
jgi:succinate dehydrogenase/fumarate reductase flavoprotein subunit